MPIEPDQVLREMWENPKRGYDTMLVKALINLIGIYPVGTCVILDTFEVGIVAAPNPEGQQLNRPHGADRGGRRRRLTFRRRATLVSLTEQDESGAYRARSSRSPIPPATGSPSATTLSESRLAPAWAALRAQERTALIPYLTAGYPSAEASLAALRAADEVADIIEVGVPFSDPLADGPTIQRSTFEALRQGMTLAGTLALIERAAHAARRRLQLPQSDPALRPRPLPPRRRRARRGGRAADRPPGGQRCRRGVGRSDEPARSHPTDRADDPSRAARRRRSRARRVSCISSPASG